MGRDAVPQPKMRPASCSGYRDNSISFGPGFASPTVPVPGCGSGAERRLCASWVAGAGCRSGVNRPICTASCLETERPIALSKARHGANNAATDAAEGLWQYCLLAWTELANPIATAATNGV